MLSGCALIGRAVNWLCIGRSGGLDIYSYIRTEYYYHRQILQLIYSIGIAIPFAYTVPWEIANRCYTCQRREGDPVLTSSDHSHCHFPFLAFFSSERYSIHRILYPFLAQAKPNDPEKF